MLGGDWVARWRFRLVVVMETHHKRVSATWTFVLFWYGLMSSAGVGEFVRFLDATWWVDIGY